MNWNGRVILLHFGLKALSGWFCSTEKEGTVVKSYCGKLPLSRRKSPLQERSKLMKFQAHMWCDLPKRERKIQKLDSNFNRPPFPAALHLFMLHHLMVSVHFLFGDMLLFFGELLSPKSPSLAIFPVRQKHLYWCPGHREPLPLFPFRACQTVFTLFSPSSFLRGLCEFSHWAFPLFIYLRSLAVCKDDKQVFLALKSEHCEWEKNYSNSSWSGFHISKCAAFFPAYPFSRASSQLWKILGVIIPLNHWK